MNIRPLGWAVVGLCLGTIAAGLSMRYHHSQIPQAWASLGSNPFPSFSQAETDLRHFLDEFRNAKWRNVQKYRAGKVWCGQVSVPNPLKTAEYTPYMKFIWGIPYVSYKWKQDGDLYAMKRRILFNVHFPLEDEHYFDEAWRSHCNDLVE